MVPVSGCFIESTTPTSKLHIGLRSGDDVVCWRVFSLCVARAEEIPRHFLMTWTCLEEISTCLFIHLYHLSHFRYNTVEGKQYENLIFEVVGVLVRTSLQRFKVHPANRRQSRTIRLDLQFALACVLRASFKVYLFIISYRFTLFFLSLCYIAITSSLVFVRL